MIFIVLLRFRQKPTKARLAQLDKNREQFVKEGGKIIGTYWTLGRYDSVTITEAPDVKTAMKTLMRGSDMASTETLVALTREEAIKLIE